MHELAFADAARPARCGILRLLMLPYSLGHELLLLQQRNEILFNGFESLHPEIQKVAVKRAALVCSRTWRQNQKSAPLIRAWEWSIRNDSFNEAISNFQAYRKDGSTVPRMADKEHMQEKPGREFGSPHLARLLNFAFSRHGESAYDQPFGLLNFLYFGEAEYEGSCMVENTYEFNVRDQIAKHLENYEREQAEKKGILRPV